MVHPLTELNKFLKCNRKEGGNEVLPFALASSSIRFSAANIFPSKVSQRGDCGSNLCVAWHFQIEIGDKKKG